MIPKRNRKDYGPRISPSSAGYMELEGAKKDGECEIVKVPGGISKELGCCNAYTPESGSTQFRCGTCKFED